MSHQRKSYNGYFHNMICSYMIDFSLLKKNHKLIINEKLLEIQLSGKEILFHDWEKGEGACTHHHNE